MVSLYMDSTKKTIPVSNHANDVSLVIHITIAITRRRWMTFPLESRAPIAARGASLGSAAYAMNSALVPSV
jgi:hypothetical protein